MRKRREYLLWYSLRILAQISNRYYFYREISRKGDLVWRSPKISATAFHEINK